MMEKPAEKYCLEANLFTDEIQMLMKDIWTGVIIINLN